MNDLLGDLQGPGTSDVPISFATAPLDTVLIDLGKDDPSSSSATHVAQMNEEFGDFQNTTPATIEPSGADIVEVDDFGEFVDSPDPDSGAFVNTIDTTLDVSQVTVPTTSDLLSYLLTHVFTVPGPFIMELGSLPYTLKRAVLNSPTTKRWLEAVVEGTKITQRIMHGRNRQLMDNKARREVQIMAERVAHEWQTSLMPRLTSLSGGTLRLRPFQMNVYDEGSGSTPLCDICHTEGEDVSSLHGSADGLNGHKSCIALAHRMSLSRQLKHGH